MLLLIFTLLFNISFAQDGEVPDKLKQDPFEESEKQITEDDVAFPGDPMTSFWNDDVASEQEIISKFYDYGRFVYVSGFVELQIPTGERANIYTAGPLVGGKFLYFLDWNFAVSISIGLGFIPIDILTIDSTSGAKSDLTGTSNLFSMDIGIRYYFNFNDISKTIAKINPYITIKGGLLAVQDNLDVLPTAGSATAASLPEYSGYGFSIYGGIGTEFFVFHKSILLGFEMGYHYLMLPSTIVGTYDYSGDALGLSLNLVWDM